MDPKLLLLLKRQLEDQESRKRLLTILLIPIFLFILILAGVASMFSSSGGTAGEPLSKEVEAYRPMVTKYCAKYEITGYEDLALALMMVESGGATSRIQCRLQREPSANTV